LTGTTFGFPAGTIFGFPAGITSGSAILSLGTTKPFTSTTFGPKDGEVFSWFVLQEKRSNNIIMQKLVSVFMI
jgi:hypothetical protein